MSAQRGTRDTFMNMDRFQRNTLVKSGKIFIEKSFCFIRSLIKNEKLTSQQGQSYCREILHSIFFLGLINKPSIYPEDVLSEELDFILRQKFPEPFEMYKTKLPSRPPYSVLLDMVVQITGDKNVPAVMKELLALNGKMHVPPSQNNGTACGNDFTLASATVSYCYFSDSQQKTKNYFGCSIACKGRIQRMIFIDQACIMTWNRNVAFAVCLTEKENRSIQLPEFVYSKALRIPNNLPEGTTNPSSRQYYLKPPCSKCLKLFPNVKFSPEAQNDRPADWMYGNCAECEAISKLLNAETSVNDRVESDLNGPTFELLLRERQRRLSENLQKTAFGLSRVVRSGALEFECS